MPTGSDITAAVEMRGVTFAPGETELFVAVNVSQFDNSVDGVEQFMASLTNTSPRVDLGDSVATIVVVMETQSKV